MREKNLEWLSNLVDLEDFYSRNNRVPTVAEKVFSSEGVNLGSWWVRQRYAYKQGVLSDARVGLLQKHLGRIWMDCINSV